MRLPDSWSRARVTLALTILCTLVWVVLAALGQVEWAAQWGGFIPLRGEIEAPGRAFFLLTPLTSSFMHANFAHLAFNLLILVFCGRPTEAVVGPVGMVLLFVAGAFGAAAAHYLVSPTEAAPMIGASGAISAVLGAYAILFGRNRVKIANPRLAVWLNALWLMVAWIILQLIIGFSFAGAGPQIAFAAHIGGFLVGVALANPLILLRYRRA